MPPLPLTSACHSLLDTETPKGLSSYHVSQLRAHRQLSLSQYYSEALCGLLGQSLVLTFLPILSIFQMRSELAEEP